MEFGRLKLPQGYHPNDVEEEWGKLIIEMLEREKLLRPAVERWVASEERPVPRGRGASRSGEALGPLAGGRHGADRISKAVMKG